jgi:DNA invertase Pin-like site-specific DNA recombinase
VTDDAEKLTPADPRDVETAMALALTSGSAMARRGKHVARKSALDPEQLDMARRMIEKENKGKATVARGMGVDPSTLRRALGGGSDLNAIARLGSNESRSGRDMAARPILTVAPT